MAKPPDQSWRDFVMNSTGLQPGPTIETAAPTPIGAAVHTAPAFDVIARLPEERRDLLRKLRQHADDRRAVVPEFETIREASMRKITAEQRLTQLQAHPQDHGFGLPDDNGSVIEVRRAVAAATADFERLQELQRDRTAAWEQASRAKTACEDFLRYGVPGTTLEAVEVEPPKLLKGESQMDGISRLQRRGRELRADLARVEAAAYPATEARAVAMTQIAALVQRGALDTSGCVEHLGPIQFPTKLVEALVHNSNSPGAVVYVEVIDAEAVIAHLLRPQLVAAVEASIAADADEPNAVGKADREKRAAVISQDLLFCERELGSLTWSAMEQSLPVEFGNINPLAILQVRLVTTPRADALPETSPGLSWPWRR